MKKTEKTLQKKKRRKDATKEDGKSLVIADIINRKGFVINDYRPLDLSLLFL